VLKLNLPPGVAAGTRYVFKEEGDRSATSIPADIVFITCDKPHISFQRRNIHDLVFTREVNLGEALGGLFFVIETLDHRKLKVAITDIITPGYQKIIPGEGLPKCRQTTIHNMFGEPKGLAPKPQEFGDLIIEFRSKKIF